MLLQFCSSFFISKRTGLIVVKKRLRSTVLVADKTFSEPIRFKIIAVPLSPPPNSYSSVICDFNLKERIHGILSNTVLGKTVESEENEVGERLPKHVYCYKASLAACSKPRMPCYRCQDSTGSLQFNLFRRWCREKRDRFKNTTMKSRDLVGSENMHFQNVCKSNSWIHHFFLEKV